MIESQFEVVRQKGEFTGPRSRMGRDITSAIGARDPFHQDSLYLCPSSFLLWLRTFIWKFSSSIDWGYGHDQGQILTDFWEKGLPSFLILGVNRKFWRKILAHKEWAHLLGQSPRPDGQDQGSFCYGKGRYGTVLPGRWRWARQSAQQMSTKGTIPSKTLTKGKPNILLN